MVRQAENLASNKENFNYLNGNRIQGEGDGYAEIDIHKEESASKTQDANVINSSDDNGEKKVVENLI